MLNNVKPTFIHAFLIISVCALLFSCVPVAQPVTITPLPFTRGPVVTATIPPPTAIGYPPSINPLTGRPVTDPELLGIPAVLLSISHFPATGRPQAGLSFAPYVYEIYITEGATRFLAVFYGEFPAPEQPLTGNCITRDGVFTRTGILLGNRVWLDLNANGIQDVGEVGVGGVCVNVYDSNGTLLQQTTTDSNGYYGFNLPTGRYVLEFIKPDWASITIPNNEASMEFLDSTDNPMDSDPDLNTGQVAVNLTTDMMNVDAGLVDSGGALQSQDPDYLPLPQVGPIRSGRLVYRYLADSYPNSCLIYAGASSEVLSQLPQCYLVFHQLAGSGYMLDIDELLSVARHNLREKGSAFDYASNIFSAEPPPGGLPASLLEVYISYLNQSAWLFDPLYEAYLRYVDTSEYGLAGVLFPDRDRLNGRQLHFDNVIVVFAEHDVVSPTNLDIRLDPGRTGKALLFRDGLMYEIRWDTGGVNDVDRRPMTFLDTAGRHIPLKPGHTWVVVVTRATTVVEKSTGEWRLEFSPPEGSQ